MANEQVHANTDVETAKDDPKADLVLEGGGVKAIAHVGAVNELEARGYSFNRVAGTSGGAITGALVAACMQNRASGRTKYTHVAEIVDLLWPGKSPGVSIDYSKLTEGKTIEPFEFFRKAASLVVDFGQFHTGNLRQWVYEALSMLNVQKFGDLKMTDPDRPDLMGDDKGYRLVVMATDISRGSLIRLPWDYRPVYGLDPADQFVADAVVASACVPGFFDPVLLDWGSSSESKSLLVDGGLCSGFPIEVFDRTDNLPPRWPTFGVKLEARPDPGATPPEVANPVEFFRGLANAAIGGNDEVHMTDPCVLERTIFVDTSLVPALEFRLNDKEQSYLFQSGQAQASAFASSWDWKRYLRSPCVKDRDRARRAQAARGELARTVQREAVPARQ